MKLLLFVTLISLLCIYDCDSYFPTESSGRAGAALNKFMYIFGVTESPNPKGATARKVRHKKWDLNAVDEEHDTTTTTQTPATKSPEQIEQEKVEERKRQNPKNFLAGENEEKQRIKEAIFGTTPSSVIDLKIKKMEEELKSLQTSCNANTDCTNKTCCMIGRDGIGKCVLKPHEIGHECSDTCLCVNNLKCKLMEVDQDKPGIITSVKRCEEKPLDENSEEFIEQLKTAIKNSKRCSSCKLKLS